MQKDLIENVEKTPAAGVRLLPLKWFLILLVTGSLLPVVIFAALVIQQLTQQHRAIAERRLIQATRDMASTLEREITSSIRILNALAESERLENGKLQEFYEESARVVKTQPSWMSVILLSPTGKQLLNTRWPYGAVLPPINEPHSFQRLVDTLQPTVGDLVPGKNQQTLAFPLRVPVLRQGQLLYVLTATISADSLNRLAKGPSPLNDEWTRTVVDSRGIVIARTRDPERFVGKSGTSSFLARVRGNPEAIHREISLEGEPVYFAFSRLSFPDWTVAVVAPVRMVEGRTRRTVLLIIAVGLALLLLSGSGAFLLSRYLSRNIVAAAAAASDVALDKRPALGFSRVAELAQLREALFSAAELLAQREQARTEHLKQAEHARAEAETASRLKDEFLATVSHELRTPLNAMLGYAKLLKGNRLDEEKARQAILIIERNAYQQAQLIEDLLDVSRIITGNLRLEVQPLNLQQVLENALDAVRPAAEAKGVRLKLRGTGEASLAGDAGRLQQVFWNLLANAVKFTPSGGQVEVCLAAHAAHVEISVRDTGQGIAPKFLPYVFDRFRQADGSTTRAAGGLGLGLAIVRHLVELHGGHVSAASDGAGQGATFTVKLPLQAVLSPPALLADGALNGHARLDAGQAGWPELRGISVLLVDDEAEVRQLVREILEQCGAEVFEAGSAKQGLLIVKEAKPSLIIADVGMPGEDGYAFLRQLRAQEDGGPPVPAIALTAFTRTEDRMRVLRAGFRRHVPKPFEPLELLLVIASLTGRGKY
jgi:signal transduction histidine kinase/CheY-like chemotaxis protein